MLRLLSLLALASLSSAFVLPGSAPEDYVDGAELVVKAVKLDSVKTALPYDYYSLPFCQREGAPVQDTTSLGEDLSGETIDWTPYKVEMKIKRTCSILCVRDYDASDLELFSKRIDEQYRVNWLLDNIPAATKYFTMQMTEGGAAPEAVEHYEKGYPLGFIGAADIPNTQVGVKYLNNHLRLIVKYHHETVTPTNDPNVPPVADDRSRVVGFEVEAYSIEHVFDPSTPYVSSSNATDEYYQSLKLTTCENSAASKPQRVSNFEDATKKQQIVFTYDVQWEESPIKWASRWDLYLKMNDSKIHWFSIINSIMIVLFLSGMVAVIMIRILHRDLSRYNSEQLSEEEQKEETGWKLIHGDVFRPPAHANWLSVLVGTGCQVFAMTLATLIFAALGFLSPANRGGLMSALLFLFVGSGCLAGYQSTRMYKMFGLTEWRRNTFVTSLFFPGVVFSIFFCLNLLVWSQHSSGAVPFGTLIALLVLWLGISVPLVFLGSFIAFSKPAIEHPVKINNLCRLLPPDSASSWYTSPHLSILLGGILPFAAVFIEIFFIMSSVWLNQFYYVFGFLFIVFVILILTCAEITIVLCYFQLCNEDYHWWWRSFLTPGSSALYLFLYSILYFYTKLQITQLVSTVLFFGYMTLVCLAFGMLTGTIGYLACFQFVTKIYASIKID